jgi:DNA-binding IclR family transcriptional regulator
MSGLNRYLSVLHLFQPQASEWTVQEIAQATEAPASTIYRQVRELVRAGFLEPATEAHYRLGAAFIEFDRIIQLTDPLLKLGSSLLHQFVDQAQVPCHGLLARLHHDQVMCIADQRGGNAPFHSSYERGLPMGLTRGATSKVILAQLPTRRLAKLVAREAAAVPPPPFARSLGELRSLLATIRRQGYCVSRSEVDSGLVGIAAPVAVAELGLAASLSLVVEAKSLDEMAERRLTLLTVSCASLLTGEMRRKAELAAAAAKAAS